MSGSGPAAAAAVATVMIPNMAKAGYPRAFSAGIIASAASTAILIPPSIALIVYSIMVPGLDLRALFVAGVMLGLLAGLSIIIPTIWISRRKGFGYLESPGRPPLMKSFMHAVPGLMAPVVILGGLRTGAFTPSEAAVLAVAYGLIVGLFIYRSLTWNDIYRTLVHSAQISAVILIIMSLAGIFAWAGSTLDAFDLGARLMFGLSDNSTVVLLLVMVVLLLAGMVLDGISIYLITLPILMPLMDRYGWNPTWFGVLMAMNIAIGQFTPPVAINLMVTAKVGGVSIEATTRWVMWFVLSMALSIGLVIAFPKIALWLPQNLGYGID